MEKEVITTNPNSVCSSPETPRKKKLARRRPKNPGYYKIVPELKRRFTRDRRSDVRDIRDIQLLLRQSGFQIQADRFKIVNIY